MINDLYVINVALVDDEEIFLRRVKSILEKNFNVAVHCFLDSISFLSSLKSNSFELLLLDLNLPDLSGLEVIDYLSKMNVDIEIIMITGHGTIDSAVEALKKGARDYILKPVDKDRLLFSIRNVIDRIYLKKENEKLKKLISKKQADTLNGFIASSLKMQEVLNIVKKVAPLDCNVLLQGETGTGKEMVARIIHELSNRKEGNFLSVNCGGFSEELITNELFGHEKEAFTGATSQKKGIFEAADKGTIFLDEIGEMSISLQVKLLKVIEEKRIFRLGSHKPINLDVRIISATNRDLKDMVKKGLFRQDLYYRLNVVTITIPPLRDRMDDVPMLISHFISKYNKRFGKNVSGISTKALSILLKYNFPGNVRELENIIQRAIALCNDKEIKPQHLPEDITNLDHMEVKENVLLSLEEMEKQHIKKVLEFTGYDKKATATILNIPRTTLWRKIKKYKL